MTTLRNSEELKSQLSNVSVHIQKIHNVTFEFETEALSGQISILTNRMSINLVALEDRLNQSSMLVLTADPTPILIPKARDWISISRIFFYVALGLIGFCSIHTITVPVIMDRYETSFDNMEKVAYIVFNISLFVVVGIFGVILGLSQSGVLDQAEECSQNTRIAFQQDYMINVMDGESGMVEKFGASCLGSNETYFEALEFDEVFPSFDDVRKIDFDSFIENSITAMKPNSSQKIDSLNQFVELTKNLSTSLTLLGNSNTSCFADEDAKKFEDYRKSFKTILHQSMQFRILLNNYTRFEFLARKLMKDRIKTENMVANVSVNTTKADFQCQSVVEAPFVCKRTDEQPRIMFFYGLVTLWGFFTIFNQMLLCPWTKEEDEWYDWTVEDLDEGTVWSPPKTGLFSYIF